MKSTNCAFSNKNGGDPTQTQRGELGPPGSPGEDPRIQRARATVLWKALPHPSHLTGPRKGGPPEKSSVERDEGLETRDLPEGKTEL